MPPNMSVSTITPSPVSMRRMASTDLAAARVHVVVGSDGDRLELRLRPDDVLQRRAELERQPAMRDDDKADHRCEPTSSRSCPAASRPGCRSTVFQLHRSRPELQGGRGGRFTGVRRATQGGSGAPHTNGLRPGACPCQRQKQLDRGRRLERLDPHQRARRQPAGCRIAVVLGQALDLACRHEVDDERQLRARRMGLTLDDADAAHLELAADGRRRLRPCRRSPLRVRQHLIVGHEHGGAGDERPGRAAPGKESQGEIGLAATRTARGSALRCAPSATQVPCTSLSCVVQAAALPGRCVGAGGRQPHDEPGAGTPARASSAVSRPATAAPVCD